MTTTIFLGPTDATECDCCGRKGLKRTIRLSIDGAEPVCFGVTCAARALGRGVADVRRETQRADDARDALRTAERKLEDARQMARWEAFLAAHTDRRDFAGKVVHLAAFDVLGGPKAAGDAFRASSFVALDVDGDALVQAARRSLAALQVAA